MRFVDETILPPTAPPAPPVAPPHMPDAPPLPYEAVARRYGMGEGIERISKLYPGGGGAGGIAGCDILLLPDELEIWNRVVALRKALATGVVPSELPPLPYEPRLFPSGSVRGREVLKKVYFDSRAKFGGESLTDEEIAVWNHMKWLEEELAGRQLSAAIDTVDVAKLPDLLAPTVAEPAVPESPPIVEPATATMVGESPTVADADPSPKAVNTGDGARAQAKSFLIDVLKNGPMPATDVATLAAAAGLSEATVKRARQELGVVPRKIGLTGWVLELPGEGDHVAEVVPPVEAGQPVVEEAQPVPV